MPQIPSNIPLEDRAKGWKVNYGYWINLFLPNSVIGIGLMVLNRQIELAWNMTLAEIILIALPSSICTIDLLIITARVWASLFYLFVCTPLHYDF